MVESGRGGRRPLSSSSSSNSGAERLVRVAGGFDLGVRGWIGQQRALAGRSGRASEGGRGRSGAVGGRWSVVLDLTLRPFSRAAVFRRAGLAARDYKWADMGEGRRCWGTCWRGRERQEGQRLGGRETYTEWLLAVYLSVCLSVHGPRPDGRRGTWTDPRVSLWRRARHATALWLWRCRLPSAIFPSLLVSSAVGEITRGSSRLRSSCSAVVFFQLPRRHCHHPSHSHSRGRCCCPCHCRERRVGGAVSWPFPTPEPPGPAWSPLIDCTNLT